VLSFCYIVQYQSYSSVSGSATRTDSIFHSKLKTRSSMSALPGCDLALLMSDHNIPETWPRAINAFSYAAQWLMAAGTSEESASFNLHYDGIQRRHMLTSLRDVTIRYEPYYNASGDMPPCKAFLILNNRQVQGFLGNRTFSSQADLALNLFAATDHLVSLMKPETGVKSISISNRTPLEHLSDYAALEVYPIGAFYFDQKPSYNMDGKHF
jgi:hypothetical protein